MKCKPGVQSNRSKIVIWGIPILTLAIFEIIAVDQSDMIRKYAGDEPTPQTSDSKSQLSIQNVPTNYYSKCPIPGWLLLLYFGIIFELIYKIF